VKVKVKAVSSGSTREDADAQCQELLSHERDYIDRTYYRAVHFHGSRLADSLVRAADFLFQLEKGLSREPYALSVSAQYSWEDEATDLAWRVTVILGQPVFEGSSPAGFRR
jgi:hypothetical protein